MRFKRSHLRHYLQASKYGITTYHISRNRCPDRKLRKGISGLLLFKYQVLLKVALVSLVVFPFSSSAFSQSDALRLTCRFVRPENPVEREGFIWKKESIKVEYKFVNISGESLMIPDPGKYSPLRFIFTTLNGDTLDYKVRTIVNYTGIFDDHTFLEVGHGNGSWKTFETNLIKDTMTVLQKGRTGLAEFEGIEYPFEKGETYRVYSKFRSELKGTVEVENTSFKIWNGEISCDEVLEFRYE